MNLQAELQGLFPGRALAVTVRPHVTQLVMTRHNGSRRAFAYYHPVDLPQPTQAELVAFFSARLREAGEDY